MHLYLPHISVLLVLISLAAIIMDGGFPTSLRTSRVLQTVAMVWVFWLLYVVTEQFIR
jgi:hypothetical protein